MRWKLLLAASLLATTVGAGASLLIMFGLLGGPALGPDKAPGLAILGALLIPLASITSASIFVYRHTARRRPLQAMATALLSGILIVTALAAGLLLNHGRAPRFLPAPTPTLRDAG